MDHLDKLHPGRILIVDRRGRWTDPSTSATEDLLAGLSPLHARSVARAIGEVFDTGESRSLEMWIQGRLVELLLAPAGDERVGWIARDIGPRPKEQVSALPSGPLGALLGNQLAAVLIADDQGTWVFANEAAGRMFGMTPDQMIGMNVGDVLVRQQPDASARYQKYVERGEETGLFEFFRADGEPRTAQYHARKIGENRHLSLLMDITEQRRLEARLEHSQRLESLGHLAGGIAHDVSNVLAVIQGCASLALAELDPEHPVRTELREIHGAARSGARLVERLLDFGRREPGPAVVIELGAYLRATVGLLERLVGGGIDLQLEISDEDCRIRIEPAHLDQILINLVTNAREAVEGRGAIWIGVRGCPPGTLQELEGLGSAAAVITVSDDGSGMDEEVRARVFEPFFTTRPRGVGTGLGLSTVHQLAARHGGRVWVASSPGCGTTVSVALPLVAGEVRQVPDDDRAPDIRGTESVLVVEDRGPVRRLVEQILVRAGFRVIPAKNGLEALATWEARREEIDVVVTDIDMPALGGDELIDRLRKQEPDLAVVWISGLLDEGHPQSGRVGEILVPKPFEPEQLLTAVRLALARS